MMDNALKNPIVKKGILIRYWTVCLTFFILSAIGISLSWGEESGGDKPNGMNSSGEMVQKDPLNLQEEGMAMPGSNQAPSRQLESEIKGMEEVLSQAHQAEAMEMPQPPVGETFQPQWDSGEGQLEYQADAGPVEKEKFLSVVLKISKDGRSEVISATEMEGTPSFSFEALSDFFYEVSDGDKTVAIQGFPMNPFEAHSFGGGPGTPEEHFFIDQQDTTVVVQIPNKDLSSRLETLGIQLYQLTEGAPVDTITETDVQSLKMEARLKPIVTLKGSELATQIQEKGHRLSE